MIYTFAGRSVVLIGKFEVPIEIMLAIIQGLGGNIIINPDPSFQPRIYVIGKHTDESVYEYFIETTASLKYTPILVHEDKFDEFVRDDLTIEQRIEKLLPYFPWYRKQVVSVEKELI